MRLDPVSLKLFVAVIEEGSIAAAAERNHIAAAAVSRRMSELEATLRTPLLLRTNRGVGATAAGLALLSRARRLLREIDELAGEMREWAGGTRGQVRIVANISSITQFLPRELADFVARHPEVQLHLEEKISSAVVRAVADNAADVGVGVAADASPGLEVFPYHRDELVLLTPAAHPLAGAASLHFADTLDHAYVGLHTGSSINLLLERGSLEAHRPWPLRIQVTSYDALARMIEAGLGIGALPRSVAESYAAALGVRIVALEDDWRHRQLTVCVRSYDGLPEAARRLVDCLRQAD